MSDADPDDTRRAWRAMSALVLSENRRTAVTEALGLSFARTRALRRLADGPLRLRELAARLGADPPYASLIVDDLEQRGLAQRTTDPDDRRAKLVQLTDDGRTLAARASAILDQPPAALQALPADEVASLLRVLDRLQQLAADAGRTAQDRSA